MPVSTAADDDDVHDDGDTVGDSDLRTLVADRLAAVRTSVSAAARAVGRDPGDVRILLATKTMPISAIRAAITAGGTLLGENRVQELVAKGPELAASPVELHLIGHLQSNKVNAVLPWVSCVQTVDSLVLAERLSARCVARDRDLDVMVQVNVSGEPSKFGVPPEQAVAMALELAGLPRLRLTGLMTIGARSSDEVVVRAGFGRLRELRGQVLASGMPAAQGAHELSMGMSRDLELAIAEGATIVRIGTAVFGARPRP